MQAYNTQTGIVCPLDRANVDTDQIIAKQFLKSIKRTGFGVNLFDDWRYLDEGYPGQDHSTRVINPEFVLNKPRYQGATILLARRNFGCGSVANMRLGRCQNMVFVPLLRQALRIFFIIIASKTACCQSY